MPAAASFKHVSPAGAAVAVPLPTDLQRAYEVEGVALTPLATAYARARGADPKSSFGDFAALSEPVDATTANYLKGVVSDGVNRPRLRAGRLRDAGAEEGRRLRGAGSESRLRTSGARIAPSLRHYLDPSPQRPSHRRRRLGERGVRLALRGRQARPSAGADCAQVHAVQLRRFHERRPDHRRRRRPAIPRGLHEARRRQGGRLAPAPPSRKFRTCASSPARNARSASIGGCATSRATWPPPSRPPSPAHSPSRHRRSRRRSARRGLRNQRVSQWPATASFPSATTSIAPSATACASSPSREARRAMRRSQAPAANTASPWRTQECACSITRQRIGYGVVGKRGKRPIHVPVVV